ncbi:MAG: GNAT family N-acetyltransferase [Rhodoglobus sp.]
MEQIAVRPIHDHEWREVKAIRLRALQDEVADIAFVDTFEVASARPDEFWQQRTNAASVEAEMDARARQIIATVDGMWVGSATVLIELEGQKDFEGDVIQSSGGALVGVYLDTEFRGRGIIQNMFDAALDWVRERGLNRARLYVNVDNLRAQKAYEKAGFRPTGATLVGSVGPELEMARDA